MNWYGPAAIVSIILVIAVTVLCYFGVQNPTSVGFITVALVPLITLLQSFQRPIAESKTATKKNAQIVSAAIAASMAPPPPPDTKP